MIVDKIEIVTEYNHIQVRIKTPLTNELGEVAGFNIERQVVECGDKAHAKKIGGLVNKLVDVIWTPELIEQYKTAKAVV